MKINTLLPLFGLMPAIGMAVKPTNIIIINLDDSGYGDFSCNGAYGYLTPNIDQMSAQGMRFTHFLAVQPISGASRAGLLTGCYPNRIGFFGAPGPDCWYGIHPNEMTIAELVKQKGYVTAIFGKWHLGDAYQFLPLQNGFDEYYGLPYSNDMWNPDPLTHKPRQPLYDGNKVIEFNTDLSRLTTSYTERSVKFIQENSRRPFLLYVAHSMPHVPLAVSDKFKGRSKQGLYGDVMMELDWSVGEILKTLRDEKIECNTLVILTSDNGPWISYGNHAGSAGGLREAKMSTFDGGTRVPCIMYWKGHITPGTICNQLASNIDLFPTVAELTGAPLPDRKIDGVSLVSLLNGEIESNPRKWFIYYYNRNDLEAVTDGDYKLVFPHRYKTSEGCVPGMDGNAGKFANAELNSPELYDLQRDPGERYNVIVQHPKVRKKLERIAEQMRGDLGDGLRNVPPSNARPAGLRKDYEN